MDTKDLYVEQGENRLYGVKSFKHPVKEWIIEPKFTYIHEFENMLNPNYTIAIQDRRAFLINQNGEKVREEYDEIYYLDGIFYKMKSNGKWGYMDANGDIKIEQQYDEAGSMIDNRAIVTINNNKLLINKSGKILSSPYKSILPGAYNSLFFIVKSTDGHEGFINNQGEIIGQIIFDSVSSFDKGVAYVEKDGYPGLINEKGEFLINPQDKKI